MFGSLKDKFHSMQEGLSASIRGLSLAETSKNKKSHVKNVNYDAGADLLHHFQLQWTEMHDIAEENAQKGQEADALIATIHEKLQIQWNSIGMINNTLSIIPKINSDIQQLMDQIGSLQESFEEVEQALFELENLQDILHLQNNQLDHRFQLALYKEKKMSELKDYREKLANQHAEKVLRHEQQQAKLLKERQETFEQAFKQELQEYKETGSIQKSCIKLQKGPSLEEIEIETDNTAFDDFLRE